MTTVVNRPSQGAVHTQQPTPAQAPATTEKAREVVPAATDHVAQSTRDHAPKPVLPGEPGSRLLDVRLGNAQPPGGLAEVRAAGLNPVHIPRDYDREGRFSVPGSPTFSVSLDDVKKAQGGMAKVMMENLALQPKGGGKADPNVVQIFVPGLNTPEPEASRRTQLYADGMNTPLVHMANGSAESLGNLPLIAADKRDWIAAGLAFVGLKTPRLAKNMADVMAATLADPTKPKLRLSVYSDSTIALGQAVHIFTDREVDRRAAALKAAGSPVDKKAIRAGVEAEMKERFFIELYGNALHNLPPGPRYLVWTDVNDSLTHGKTFFSENGRKGCSGKTPDKDYRDVVYVDYQGPFSDKGFNAHNLAANGISVVQETLRRNGATSGEQLYALAKSGKQLAIPGPTEVQGDVKELWP